MSKVVNAIRARVEVIGQPKESSHRPGTFYYSTMFIDLSQPVGSEASKIWKSLTGDEVSQICKGDRVLLVPTQEKNGKESHNIVLEHLNNAYDKPSHPTVPGEWTLAQIQEALKRPLPASMIATRKQGGATLEYIPWHTVNRVLDKYAPGWTFQIVSMHTTSDRLFLTGRLSIPTTEGMVTREATGTELLACGSYGDPSSNAESMAFRRCAARFGLGLYLYEKD